MPLTEDELRILVYGGTVEEVARVLGVDPNAVSLYSEDTTIPGEVGEGDLLVLRKCCKRTHRCHYEKVAEWALPPPEP